MEKIIVYQSSNFKNKFFRYYHDFFNVLIDRLKEKYNVVEDRFFEKADDISRFITLSDNSSYQILECELLIENLSTDKIYLVSVCDLLSNCSIDLQYNKRFARALLSQYNKNEIHKYIKAENTNKFLPWIYFPYISDDLKKYYERRVKIREFKNELFFSTSAAWYRPILNHISPAILSNVNYIGDFNSYCNEAIQYKIGLSLGGKGDICYRDVEYLGLGIPFIRFKYNSDLNPPLIPNFHYICVDNFDTSKRDKDGGIEQANLIKKRFLEVCNNKNFLDYVSQNGLNYYNTYLKYPNNIEYTLQLLNL